ncbi:hypothetical protein SAMN02745671_01553 [Anaerovibrio lipolyticus DSM 3074]|uniref:Uncharacterized protein n=2 Tax=Anaerovibrio lipolyticus TaxID=82374 RepID=A0A0B2JY84_9FIRM|nr:hypothetical protein [Anaerovibrio lipolyticus]KHM51663.1 hypothetical protein NZ47_09185 [Anaerovibrio lipolyticus]SHI75218.1 hypothetical protein SAMN02745671_01553 [Anaerovibrio lipolyticus DSM 3074]
MKVNIENPAEAEMVGMLALQKALGPVGTVRFLQRLGKGSGDYTKEKYERKELSMEEVMAGMDAIEAARNE